MRPVAVVALLALSLLSGCASWRESGERAVSDAERERHHGRRPSSSFDFFNPDRDRDHRGSFNDGPFE